MPIDFAALRGERPAAASTPQDGLHVARLERAVLHDPDGPKPSLITEWSNQANVWWTSWNRFTPDQYGLPRTLELLDGLGIDRGTLMDDDALTQALADIEGTTYQVRTSSQKGSRGDRWFTETIIEQQVSGAQTSLEDIPADTAELKQPGNQADTSSDFDDSDIPF